MAGKEFIIPKHVRVQEGSTEKYARITVEPFMRGYATTVGNSLRRVLLSSLEGSAVTAVRFEGVPHEFSAIPGIHEDATDIVLNLKRLHIRLNQKEPLIFTFTRKGEGTVTAEDLFRDQNVDVFNPDFVLFHMVNKSAQISMEIKVARGRGFVTAQHFELEHAPLGTIYMDANFSPVIKVNFQVEDARVGQVTDYERLILDIWTNGSITPEQALEEAAGLLMEHFRIFASPDYAGPDGTSEGDEKSEELRKLLTISVEELDLDSRTANVLKAAKIKTLGELVTRREQELLRFRNFGKESLKKLEKELERRKLSLGMTIPGYTPPPLEYSEESD
jgi:DNA-directed RNA polymerase subunit alpha